MAQAETYLVDARKLAALSVATAAALVLVGLFVWMVPPAADREVLAACTGLRPSLTNPMLGEIPALAPDFEVKDQAGQSRKLSDLRGKVVLLNFWASWCGVCKSEKPSLVDMTRDMASTDFEVITLASDRDWAEVTAALGESPPFRVYLDPPAGDENLGQIAAAWGLKAVPESFLIDRQGRVRYYFINKRDWDSKVAETCLQSIIDE